MTLPIFNNLHSKEYSQGLCYYSFAVNLDRCVVVTLLMICLIEYAFQTTQNI